MYSQKKNNDKRTSIDDENPLKLYQLKRNVYIQKQFIPNYIMAVEAQYPNFN